MRMRISLAIFAGGFLAAARQDPAALQKSLSDTDVQGAWFYNDLGAGFTEAKKTGKPMLVVFR